MTKFIRIGIADKNDNPPYFDKDLYEAEVDENEDIQHTVLTVTAKDHDECEYIIYLFIACSEGLFVQENGTEEGREIYCSHIICVKFQRKGT